MQAPAWSDLQRDESNIPDQPATIELLSSTSTTHYNGQWQNLLKSCRLQTGLSLNLKTPIIILLRRSFVAVNT